MSVSINKQFHTTQALYVSRQHPLTKCSIQPKPFTYGKYRKMKSEAARRSMETTYPAINTYTGYRAASSSCERETVISVRTPSGDSRTGDDSTVV